MGVPASVVRTEIGDSSYFETFVDVLGHKDPYIRNISVASLLRLDDTRAYEYLRNALTDGDVAEQGKQYAALALAGIFGELPTIEQNYIVDEKYLVSDETREILQGLKASGVDVSEAMFLPFPYDEGWAFVGTFVGGKWYDTWFDMPRDGELPKVGDTMVANWSRSLREDVIDYDIDDNVWVDADVVGLLREGGKIEVSGVKDVLGAYYWVKVKPLPQ